jgi:hypothetical protein
MMSMDGSALRKIQSMSLFKRRRRILIKISPRPLLARKGSLRSLSITQRRFQGSIIRPMWYNAPMRMRLLARIDLDMPLIGESLTLADRIVRGTYKKIGMLSVKQSTYPLKLQISQV